MLVRESLLFKDRLEGCPRREDHRQGRTRDEGEYRAIQVRVVQA